MTQRLEQDFIEAMDGASKEQLFATLYHQLHRLAQRELNRHGQQFSMQTTVLLHEVYLSLSNRDGLNFPDSDRFLAYVARAMRGIIIDAARRRQAVKHGASVKLTQLDSALLDNIAEEPELTRVDEALQKLALIDAPLATLVDLRYFGGLSLAAIASMQGLTERTMQRKWEKARLLLYSLLSNDELP